MNDERRLGKLEASQPPLAAVLMWLAEAKAYGSLPVSVEGHDEPGAPSPIARIRNQVRTDVERSMRGQARQEIEQAVRRANRDAAFFFVLVLRLNLATLEMARDADPRIALLVHQLFILMLEDELDDVSGGVSPMAHGSERIGLRQGWAGALANELASLYAAEAACSVLEHRYLDGQDALFPDVHDIVGTCRASAEKLARLGEDLLPPLNAESGDRPAAPDRPACFIDDVQARAAARGRAVAVELRDHVRVEVVDLLGGS